MEKSHQRTMMEMRRTHRQELDRVVQEKDQLLKEEADATQAGFTRDIVSCFGFGFAQSTAYKLTHAWPSGKQCDHSVLSSHWRR